MPLTYRPLLETQQELLELPPGSARFRRYLREMVGDDGDLELPLPLFNPMGKEGVRATLDRALALGLDRVAAVAVDAVREDLEAEGGAPELALSLVVGDDAAGGWTNRAASEFGLCFRGAPLYRRGMAAAALWTSEEPSFEATVLAVRAACARAAWERSRLPAATLEELLEQERFAARIAGRPCVLDEAGREATAAAARTLAEAEDMPTWIAFFFGDAAAAELGYTPLGLPPRAGFEWAGLDP